MIPLTRIHEWKRGKSDDNLRMYIWRKLGYKDVEAISWMCLFERAADEPWLLKLFDGKGAVLAEYPIGSYYHGSADERQFILEVIRLAGVEAGEAQPAMRRVGVRVTGYRYFTRYAHSDQEAMSEVALELSGQDVTIEVVGDELEIAYDIEQMHVASDE